MKNILTLSAAALAVSCASAPQPKPTALEQGKQYTREQILNSLVAALGEQRLGANPDGSFVFCFENFRPNVKADAGVVSMEMLKTSTRVAKIRALREKCALQGQNDEGARGCLPGPDNSVKGNTVTVSFDCVDSGRDVSCTSSDVDTNAVVMPVADEPGRFVSCAKAVVGDFERTQTDTQPDNGTSGGDPLDSETARMQEELRQIQDDIRKLEEIQRATDELWD